MSENIDVWVVYLCARFVNFGLGLSFFSRAHLSCTRFSVFLAVPIVVGGEIYQSSATNCFVNISQLGEMVIIFK